MFTQVDGVGRVPNRKGDLDAFFFLQSRSKHWSIEFSQSKKKLLLVIQGEEHVCSLVPRPPPCRKTGQEAGYKATCVHNRLFPFSPVIALYISQRFYFEGGG